VRVAWIPRTTSKIPLGALLVAGAFSKGLSIDECIMITKDTARTRSLRRPFTNLPNHYSSTRINSIFKKSLGPGKTVFKSSGNTRVAFVASSTKDSSIHLFSNYNGPKPRPTVHG
jgi:hypothetical protein